MLTFVKIWITMAVELQHTIDRVNAKMQILLDRYALIRQRRQEAEAKVAELEATLAKLRADNEDLRRQVEFLRIANTIVPNRKDVESSRTLLSELVREIDKCIADLNE